MKKIKITKLLCVVMAVFLGYHANAQCPVGSTEVTVTYTTGTFDTENAWSLWDATSGTELLCYATNQSGASTQTTCVTHDNNIELRTWESFGDGWNGSTITVATTEDGTVNGCPNMATL